MPSLSIVIVCRNESRVIAETLKSLEGVTDDIILFDNGSDDDTISVAEKFRVNIHRGKWEGFGKTKNKANALAKYDWILSLDADEGIDHELKQALLTFNEQRINVIYKVRFRNFLGDKALKYGEWGNDWHKRLFNRKVVKWNDDPVHEELIMPADVMVKRIAGLVLHRTAENVYEYKEKTIKYALLNAEKYSRQGKVSSWWKMYLGPVFAFCKYYFFKAGFLDGYAGYVCAKATAYYTFLKYKRLRELNRGRK